MDDVFLNNQQQQQQVQQFHEKTTNSTMMKFKSNNVYSGPRGVVSANSPYARAMPVHSNKISHVILFCRIVCPHRYEIRLKRKDGQGSKARSLR